MAWLDVPTCMGGRMLLSTTLLLCITLQGVTAQSGRTNLQPQQQQQEQNQPQFLIPFLATVDFDSASGMAKILGDSALFKQATDLEWWYNNMFRSDWAATLFMPTDEALTSFATAVGPNYTSQTLQDAFKANPQQFWSLIRNQIVNNITLLAVNFTEGREITAMGGEKLTLSKDENTGLWMINNISTISPVSVTAAETAIHTVNRFVTLPDVATWGPLLAAAAAAAPPAAAAARTEGGNSSNPLASTGARIGISVGISLCLALLIGIASFLCVMYKRRRQRQGQNPWVSHNAPGPVLAAAAASSSKPWQQQQRGGLLGFGRRPRRHSRAYNHQPSIGAASSSSSSSFFAGMWRWKVTGFGVWGSKKNMVGLSAGDAVIPVPGRALYGANNAGVIHGEDYDSDDEDELSAGMSSSRRITHNVFDAPDGIDEGNEGEFSPTQDVETGFEGGCFANVQHTDWQQWQQQQQEAAAAASVMTNGITNQYPAIPGGITGVAGESLIQRVTPAVTYDRYHTFVTQWQEAGCPGGRVLALPLFSMVLPNRSELNLKAAAATGTAAAAAVNHSNPTEKGAAPDVATGQHTDQALCTGDQGLGTEEQEGLAKLGSWAVEALHPGGLAHQSPLLRQVIFDLVSGRHPVTHNFYMDQHQTPVARHNTVLLFAHNKNNTKRATIKFYAPRSPGYAAETSAYYQLASRHLPFLESTFNSPDGSYASALVMECGEQSLRDMLAEHRPTELTRKVEMFHQLVLDVRHMHSHNLVHRDLQPKHLLFCNEGLSWKLIDFSTSVVANSMVVPEVLSLEYAAPEVAQAVARGDRAMVATAAADMWSAGIMAYEMATGQTFYPANWTNEDIWKALLGLAPLPNETIDIVARAAPGEKAFMKKVAHLLQRNPMNRMTAERLASSRLFSVVQATTTTLPMHLVPQQQNAAGSSEDSRELFKRLGSINRTLERLGFKVDESSALGMNILKELTVHSLVLSVNLQELKPHLAPATPVPQNPRAPRVLETANGAQVLTSAGLSIGQAGALGLVDKMPAPLADDGNGNPIFLLRQGSSYLVEITVMHAKGQQLPDQTGIDSLQLEAPDGSKQALALGPTCRSRSQLMVSAIWEPGNSRSRLVNGVTPKKWGTEGSVPLNLTIWLTMCLLPGALPATAAAAAVDSASSSSSRFGKVEPVLVSSELTVRVCPANASFKAVRTFRYVEECWQALPPEARGVMQGLVLLVRGAAGGAAAVAGLMR